MRLDHSARTTRAVGHGGRDRQLAPTADLHALDARIPAGNDLALAELELERLPAVPGRVELGATGKRHADVVHRHLLARRRFFAVADDEIFDAKVEWDVAFGLLDLRTFKGQSALLHRFAGCIPTPLAIRTVRRRAYRAAPLARSGRAPSELRRDR